VPCALKRLVDAYRRGLDLKKEIQKFNAVVEWTIPTNHDMHSDVTNGRQANPFDFLEYLMNELRDVEWMADTIKIEDLSRTTHETEWSCNKCDNITTHLETPGEAGHGYGMSVNILEPERDLYKMSEYLRLNGYREKLEIRCETAECLQKYGKKTTRDTSESDVSSSHTLQSCLSFGYVASKPNGITTWTHSKPPSCPMTLISMSS
jgi:uncharacterized UBP type Zn finger protein